MDQKKDAAKRFTALLAAAILMYTVTLVFPKREDTRAAVETMAPAAAALEPLCASADRTTARVVPLGRTVGIKLLADGVLVVGMADVATDHAAVSPAKRMGLKVGDVILGVNDREVDTIEQMQDAIRTLAGQEMTLQVLRDDQQIELSGAAVRSEQGGYQLGAWIRDSMAGIGTMTFYDPETGRFAALGHGINDVDTAQLMTLQSGSIMPSTVIGVKKGAGGAPGELRGSFDLEQDLGELSANTGAGVFGKLYGADAFDAGEAVEVARRTQVKTGPVTILANVSGEEVKEYQAEIVHLYPATADRTRNLMLRVTDPELLETTGGIVQGMSGSPILQNGRLVGAVTHVLINDPTRGYGILAENMLERMSA